MTKRCCHLVENNVREDLYKDAIILLKSQDVSRSSSTVRANHDAC